MIRTQRHSRFVLMSLDEIRATRDIVLQTEETKSNFSGSGKTVYICEVVRPCDYQKETDTAADKLAAEGISCEVLDPRTILPFDEEAAKASVSKTHRCVIVEESNLRSGLGAEWAAMLQEAIFDELDAPIKRVASLDVPLPYNLGLEARAVPNPDKIVAAVKALF